MKQTLWTLLVIGGVLAAPQGAMAVFVFNPTLTMHQAYHSPTPPLAKATIPGATDRTARHQGEARRPAEGPGAGQVEIENVAFPRFGMNE